MEKKIPDGEVELGRTKFSCKAVFFALLALLSAREDFQIFRFLIQTVAQGSIGRGPEVQSAPKRYTGTI